MGSWPSPFYLLFKEMIIVEPQRYIISSSPYSKFKEIEYWNSSRYHISMLMGLITQVFEAKQLLCFHLVHSTIRQFIKFSKVNWSHLFLVYDEFMRLEFTLKQSSNGWHAPLILIKPLQEILMSVIDEKSLHGI